MEPIEKALGLGIPAEQLAFSQLALRGLIIVIVTVAMIRVAGRRFIAQRNPLDVMLAFILGSMLARDINGNSAFWGTIGTGFVLVIFYRVVAFWACKSDSLGRLIKGRADTLVENGTVRSQAMNRHQISHNDLMEDLHLAGHVDNVNEVRLAQIERSGDISVLRTPQIITVGVSQGVQTIQIRVV